MESECSTPSQFLDLENRGEPEYLAVDLASLESHIPLFGER